MIGGDKVEDSDTEITTIMNGESINVAAAVRPGPGWRPTLRFVVRIMLYRLGTLFRQSDVEVSL